MAKSRVVESKRMFWGDGSTLEDLLSCIDNRNIPQDGLSTAADPSLKLSASMLAGSTKVTQSTRWVWLVSDDDKSEPHADLQIVDSLCFFGFVRGPVFLSKERIICDCL